MAEFDLHRPSRAFCYRAPIGIVAGVLFDRFAGPGWLSRQISGSTRGLLTRALIGVAGSFVGYHLATIIARSSSSIALFISAVLGAAIALWTWRVVR